MIEITQLPCVLDGESNEAYHERKEFISASRLKTIAKSPFHYSQYFLNPNKDATESQALGTIVHTLLLEPHLFEKENYVMKEKIDRRTKDGREKYNEALLACGGRNIVSIDDYDTAILMRDSALRNDAVMKLLDSGMAEQSIYYIDTETGLKCKARCDFRRSVNGRWHTVVDLKTTNDASPGEFNKTMVKYDYLTQAGMQCEAINVALGFEVEHYFYIAIENTFPYATCVYKLSSDDLFIGKMQYASMIKKVKDCTESGIWGSYETLPQAVNGVIEIQLPSWRKNLI